MRIAIGFSALLLFGTGCAPSEPTTPGTDAGRSDAGRVDGGPETSDAGAEASDTGVRDAGRPDAGPLSWPPSRVDVPALPTATPTYGSHPVDESGRPIVADTGRARLSVDVDAEPGPLDVMGECLAMTLACRGAGHTTDECFFSLPRCATARGWEEPDCCPTECWSAYEAARLGGRSSREALRDAFHQRPSCVPGLEALRGAP